VEGGKYLPSWVHLKEAVSRYFRYYPSSHVWTETSSLEHNMMVDKVQKPSDTNIHTYIIHVVPFFVSGGGCGHILNLNCKNHCFVTMFKSDTPVFPLILGNLVAS
jgi:hypothetical protein